MAKRIGIIDDSNKIEIEDYNEDWRAIFDHSYVLTNDNVRGVDDLVLVLGDNDKEVMKLAKEFLKSEIDKM